MEFLPLMFTVLRTGDAQSIGQKASKMGTRTHLQATLFPDLQANTFLEGDQEALQGHMHHPMPTPHSLGHLQLIWKFDYKPRGTVI